MNLYDELARASAEGATIPDVEARAGAALANLPPAGSDPVADLELAFAALISESRDANNRFRRMGAAGVHGGEPDPRVMPFVATTTYMRSGGLYLPDELAMMVATGQVPEAWRRREARRLLAFLGVLRVLIRELDDGKLHPWSYGDEVISLARKMGRLSVADEP